MSECHISRPGTEYTPASGSWKGVDSRNHGQAKKIRGDNLQRQGACRSVAVSRGERVVSSRKRIHKRIKRPEIGRGGGDLRANETS